MREFSEWWTWRLCQTRKMLCFSGSKGRRAVEREEGCGPLDENQMDQESDRGRENQETR